MKVVYQICDTNTCSQKILRDNIQGVTKGDISVKG